MGEVFVAELRDGDAVEKRYQARIVAMRRDKHLYSLRPCRLQGEGITGVLVA
jgi:hypothetical protein